MSKRYATGFSVVRVSGLSMIPVLAPRDLLVVQWGGDVGVGDVVVVEHPKQPDLLLIKRLVRIDDDGAWVMGDNPGTSDDSRDFGAVRSDAIVGRALARVWPWPWQSMSHLR